MRDRRDRQRTAMTVVGGQLIVSERLATFRRLYRWLNLTLVHQATWPLFALLASAPTGPPAETPMPWYLARLAAPAGAALLAWLYLRQIPPSLAPSPPSHRLQTHASGDASGAPTTVPPFLTALSPCRLTASSGEGTSTRRDRLTTQARFFLLGLPVMVAVARLVVGPVGPAAKLIAFGAADVAAYHLIHFGVVVRSYPDRAYGTAVATLLFAVSWGLHDVLQASLVAGGASFALAFAGGTFLGLMVALVARALRRWPGGALPAAATHWLVIYLIFGFAR